ncbi:hypothetical protein AWN76_006440 [Rhodothermaceae bacterium RA]|nr:hypothetical protein AWN76_006440 [Rhodothermaceae bacterium RA]
MSNGAEVRYVVRSAGLGGVRGEASAPLSATPTAGRPDVYLEWLARRAFDFFWQEANPANGLVRDRSTNPDLASIAAVGFGLSAITVGIDRGWITRAQGVERVLNTLRFFWNSPHGPEADATGYRGFYYHFLRMDTGRRAGTSELSTIDTALLLGGVLHAGMYFDADTPEEAEIRDLADRLYARVEWDWAVVRPPLVSMGWRPESGFIGFDWQGYNEAMLLYVLALGSPTHPLGPEAWDAWTRTYRWESHYGYSFVRFPPLFGHQYSHVWIDFRGIQDAYMRGKGIDYFENSRRATLANRAYAIDNPRGYPNYGPNEWGLTASDVPDGYRARGAPPPQNDDGTLAPTAPGGSFPFTPEESRAALRTFYARYHGRLWGPYGLRDAYNVARDWFAPAYLGIDQGPILLMYENHRTGAIWDAFMRHPAVQRGLERAGFTPAGTAATDRPAPPATLSATVAPHPVRTRFTLRYTLPTDGPATLTLYDVLGREVAVLVDAWQPAGSHAVSVPGEALAAGIYLYVLRQGSAVRSGTFVRIP